MQTIIIKKIVPINAKKYNPKGKKYPILFGMWNRNAGILFAIV
jgi:hypothetical protein